MAASTIATIEGGAFGSRRYLTHCASRRSMTRPAAFSTLMWRDILDWLAPSFAISSHTQCSLPSHKMARAARRVGSARAERMATTFCMKICYKLFRICAIAHIVTRMMTHFCGRWPVR